MSSLAIRATFAALTIGTALAAPAVHAAAIRDASLFTGNTVPRNDDGSTGLVSLGFTANFFGNNANSVYVNNNGNITFGSPLVTYTPFGLLSTNLSIIAPFFADVDTRGSASGVTQYGTGTLDGRNVFGVNWINVGYFPSATNKLNSFQLILTDRADTGAGNFDFEFNYDQILWETGGASGGSNGLGGNSARAGWSNGSNASFELTGSAVNGAFLDDGPYSLVSGSRNSGVAGRYIFQVRNGAIDPPTGTIPEPGSLLLAGLALGAAGLLRRRAR